MATMTRPTMPPRPTMLPANIDSLRTIVAEKQARKLRWGGNPKPVLADMFTASAIVAVYDAANDATKATMEAMIVHSPSKLARLAGVCFKCVR